MNNIFINEVSSILFHITNVFFKYKKHKQQSYEYQCFNKNKMITFRKERKTVGNDE